MYDINMNNANSKKCQDDGMKIGIDIRVKSYSYITQMRYECTSCLLHPLPTLSTIQLLFYLK